MPISQSALSGIERGSRRITLDEAFAICAVLGVSPPMMMLPISKPHITTVVTPHHRFNLFEMYMWLLGRSSELRVAFRPNPNVFDVDSAEFHSQEVLATLDEIRDEMQAVGPLIEAYETALEKSRTRPDQKGPKDQAASIRDQLVTKLRTVMTHILVVRDSAGFLIPLDPHVVDMLGQLDLMQGITAEELTGKE